MCADNFDCRCCRLDVVSLRCVFHFDCAYLVLLREVFDRHRQLLEVFGRRLLLLARWIAAERWLALSAKRAEPLGHYLRRMKESAYSSRSA